MDRIDNRGAGGPEAPISKLVGVCVQVLDPDFIVTMNYDDGWSITVTGTDNGATVALKTKGTLQAATDQMIALVKEQGGW